MKISITCVTPVLQAILDFFPDIISFQHVFHLGVDRSQIEWKLKAKTQISVFPWAKIGQNDHSNPYIESTTVLSDNVMQILCIIMLCPQALYKINHVIIWARAPRMVSRLGARPVEGSCSCYSNQQFAAVHFLRAQKTEKTEQERRAAD